MPPQQRQSNMQQNQNRARFNAKNENAPQQRFESNVQSASNTAPQLQKVVSFQERPVEARFSEQMEVRDCTNEAEQAIAPQIVFKKILIPVPEQFCRSMYYEVHEKSGHSLNVTVEQGTFIKNYKGTQITTDILPRGQGSESQGKIIATDSESGASACRRWHWEMTKQATILSFWEKIARYISELLNP